MTQTKVEACPWPDLDLADMMKRARAEGLWFCCAYQQLWFSPDELEAHWGEGRFRWGAVNWKIRNPSEGLARLIQKETDAKEEREAFERRMGRA